MQLDKLVFPGFLIVIGAFVLLLVFRNFGLFCGVALVGSIMVFLEDLLPDKAEDTNNG